MMKATILFGVGVMLLLISGPTVTTTSENNVTFTKDVAPIFYKNCTGCHRPGEIAPMSLLTYNDARPWAKSIREKVANRDMPPWHADPKYGEWRNDRRISQEAINTILAWVNNGAKEGDPKDLPAMPEYTPGWKTVNRIKPSRLPNNPCRRKVLLIISTCPCPLTSKKIAGLRLPKFAAAHTLSFIT